MTMVLYKLFLNHRLDHVVMVVFKNMITIVPTLGEEQWDMILLEKLHQLVQKVRMGY